MIFDDENDVKNVFKSAASKMKNKKKTHCISAMFSYSGIIRQRFNDNKKKRLWTFC